MPIYEYECKSCHHHFDLMQKMSENAVKECPECHEDTVVRLISAAGFQLKGSGWYATDFKDKAKPAVKNETAGGISENTKEKKSTETTATTTKGDSE